jgi:hypothetical protein
MNDIVSSLLGPRQKSSATASATGQNAHMQGDVSLGAHDDHSTTFSQMEHYAVTQSQNIKQEACGIENAKARFLSGCRISLAKCAAPYLSTYAQMYHKHAMHEWREDVSGKVCRPFIHDTCACMHACTDSCSKVCEHLFCVCMHAFVYQWLHDIPRRVRCPAVLEAPVRTYVCVCFT